MTRIERLLYKAGFSRTPPTDPGTLAHAPEYMIRDGVDYSRPPVVPHAARQAGGEAVKRIMEAESDYRGQTGAPYIKAGDYAVSMPTDDPLAEWDYNTRRTVLENCHAAYHRNPLAKQAVDLTRRFVVGKGHTVNAQNKQVQQVIDEFRANLENNITGYDRTFIQDLQIDGELFVRFHVDTGGGQVVITPIAPWHIQDIKTDPGFIRRVEYYHEYYTWQNSSDPSGVSVQIDNQIPAADVLHIAINNHSYELRGRPDLFVILPWLKAHKDWIEDRARQNKWRGALLWWVKIAGAAPGTIAAKLAQWKRPPTPGSAYVSSDKEEVTALTNPINAGDAGEDGRQIRMMNAIGMGLPEYMLGDGENANLATATAQQLPALWKFSDGQELMREMVWTPIYKRVIQVAVDAGLLPEMLRIEDGDGDPVMKKDQEQTIKATDAFTVEYYDLQAPEPKTLGEALALATSERWISQQAAREKSCANLGLDAAAEEKRIANEDEKAQEMGGRGTEITTDDLPGENEDAPADNSEDNTERATAA